MKNLKTFKADAEKFLNGIKHEDLRRAMWHGAVIFAYLEEPDGKVQFELTIGDPGDPWAHEGLYRIECIASARLKLGAGDYEGLQGILTPKEIDNLIDSTVPNDPNQGLLKKGLDAQIDETLELILDGLCDKTEEILMISLDEYENGNQAEE
jgi:hypothetical protein